MTFYSQPQRLYESEASQKPASVTSWQLIFAAHVRGKEGPGHAGWVSKCFKCFQRFVWLQGIHLIQFCNQGEDSQKKPGQNVNVFLEDLTEVVVANVEELRHAANGLIDVRLFDVICNLCWLVAFVRVGICKATYRSLSQGPRSRNFWILEGVLGLLNFWFCQPCIPVHQLQWAIVKSSLCHARCVCMNQHVVRQFVLDPSWLLFSLVCCLCFWVPAKASTPRCWRLWSSKHRNW